MINESTWESLKTYSGLSDREVTLYDLLDVLTALMEDTGEEFHNELSALPMGSAKSASLLLQLCTEMCDIYYRNEDNFTRSKASLDKKFKECSDIRQKLIPLVIPPKKLDEAEEQLRKLKEKLRQAEADKEKYDALTAEIAKVRQQLSSIPTYDIDAKQEELDRLKDMIGSENNHKLDLEGKLKHAKNMLTMLQSANHALEDQKTQLDNDITAQTNANDAVGTAISTLNTSLTNLRTAKGKLDQNRTELRNQVLDLNTEVNALNHDISTLQGNITTLNSDKAKMTSKKADLANQEAELNNDCSTLKSEIKTLEESTKQLDKDLAQLQNDMPAMETLRNKKQQEVTDFDTTYIAPLKAVIADLETQLQKKQETEQELKNTKSDLAKKIQDILATDAEIEKAKSDLAAKTREHTGKQHELTGLHTEKGNLENDIIRISGEKSVIEKAIQGLENTKSSLETQKANLSEQWSASDQEREGLEKGIAKLEKDIADLKPEIDKLQEQKTALDAAISSNSTQIQTLKKQIESLRIKDGENVETRYQRYLSELKAAIEELTAARKACDTLPGEIVKAEKEAAEALARQKELEAKKQQCISDRTQIEALLDSLKEFANPTYEAAAQNLKVRLNSLETVQRNLLGTVGRISEYLNDDSLANNPDTEVLRNLGSKIKSLSDLTDSLYAQLKDCADKVGGIMK